MEYTAYATAAHTFSIIPALYHYFPSSSSEHFFVGWGTGVYVAENEPALGLKPLIGLSFKPSFEISMEYNLILGFPPNYLALKTSLGLKLGSVKRPTIKKKDLVKKKENQSRAKGKLYLAYGLQYISNNDLVGFGTHLYPKWYLSQKLTVGLDLELSLLVNRLSDGGDVVIGVLASSIFPTIDYYFTKTKIKPFIGLGFGAYSFFIFKTYFGAKPKIGISIYDIINLSWEYNRLFTNSNEVARLTAIKASFNIKSPLGRIKSKQKTSHLAQKNNPNLTPKKDIRLHFGFHYSTPDGVGIHLYPKWYYSQKLAFGLNLELVGIEGGRMIRGPFNNVETLSPEIVSLMPTVDYYLTNTRVRPFVGFGIGMYYSVLFRTERTTSIGLKPKIGLSFNRIFELSIEYNRIFSNHITITTFNNHYLAFKASFGLGIIQSKRAKDK